MPGRLRVLPEFASRRHLPSRLARLRELDGRAAVQVRGPGTEFDSLREYVIGDDVRSIDWRATARRSDVVVRTWRPERDRRVLIVLDTRPHVRRAGAGRPPARRVDRGGAAARRAAPRRPATGSSCSSSTAGCAAGWPARRAPRVMPAVRRHARRWSSRRWSRPTGRASSAQVRQRLSQRALVVLLTALDPAAVEQGLLGVAGQLTERHQVVLASVSDPEVDALRTARTGAAAVFDAAAAERVGLERAAVAVRLRQRGAEVVDALPDDLAPRLADTYLALKAAGRL